jgi:phenylacetic acid degradation operon negative regulatory protein
MTPIVSHILGGDPPRVWSFIVTIFGDLAREDDRYISSRILNRLTAEIGVKPEATRVALHRLRKEDWLESTKFGRESHYRLTNKGRKLSREAAPRIYERALDHPRWLSLYDPAASAPDGLRILSGMSLVEREHKGAMNIALEHPLPQWMVDRLVDQDVQIGAKKLQQRLQTVAQISDLSDLDRVVLRLSIVHEWRRIILRIPDLPDQVLANGIPIKELRQGVQQLLASVSDVTLDYVDRASKS